MAGGGELLTVAVTIKLARVALMAPVVAGAAVVRNRRGAATEGSGRRPPVLPLFVVGFIAMMAVATIGVVPAAQLAQVKLLQQFLLTTAMFALGLGVHIASLRRLGLRPVLLGLCSTLVILAVVLTGVALGGGARL